MAAERDQAAMAVVAANAAAAAAVAAAASGTASANPAAALDASLGGGQQELIRVLFVESLLRRSEFVRQAFVEHRARRGTVAVVVVAPAKVMDAARAAPLTYGTTATDLKLLTVHPEMRRAILRDIHAVVAASGAALPAEWSVGAIHLTPEVFSVENGLTLPDPAELAATLGTRAGPSRGPLVAVPLTSRLGGSGGGAELLNRDALRGRYARVLGLLFDSITPPGERAAAAVLGAAADLGGTLRARGARFLPTRWRGGAKGGDDDAADAPS